MLRITVELVPFGDEKRKRKIAEMVIANDLSGGYDTGGYQAWTAADDWSGDKDMYGKLSAFDRSQSVWELIRLMLEVIRLERPKAPKEKDSLAQRLRKRMLIPIERRTAARARKKAEAAAKVVQSLSKILDGDGG
jgi:hypothetical protein